MNFHDCRLVSARAGKVVPREYFWFTYGLGRYEIQVIFSVVKI